MLISLLLIPTAFLLVGCRSDGTDAPAVTLTEEAGLLLADVGLVPDEAGVYILSEDADELDAQIRCIYSEDVYPYVQDTVFRVKGMVGCYKTVEDPTIYVYIDLCDADGEVLYRIEAVTPDNRIDDEVFDHIMSGDNLYILTGTFGYFKVEHRDNKKCPMFFVESFEYVPNNQVEEF